jgi:hypothetical protein
LIFSSVTLAALDALAVLFLDSGEAVDGWEERL